MTRPARCPATASNGDGCARRDPHGLEDIHNRDGHVWGARDPFVPEWRRRMEQAYRERGRVALKALDRVAR